MANTGNPTRKVILLKRPKGAPATSATTANDAWDLDGCDEVPSPPQGDSHQPGCMYTSGPGGYSSSMEAVLEHMEQRSPGSSSQQPAPQQKTLEEREEEYLAARRRIFGTSSNASSSPSNGSRNSPSQSVGPLVVSSGATAPANLQRRTAHEDPKLDPDYIRYRSRGGVSYPGNLQGCAMGGSAGTCISHTGNPCPSCMSTPGQQTLYPANPGMPAAYAHASAGVAGMAPPGIAALGANGMNGGLGGGYGGRSVAHQPQAPMYPAMIGWGMHPAAVSQAAYSSSPVPPVSASVMGMPPVGNPPTMHHQQPSEMSLVHQLYNKSQYSMHPMPSSRGLVSGQGPCQLTSSPEEQILGGAGGMGSIQAPSRGVPLPPCSPPPTGHTFPPGSASAGDAGMVPGGYVGGGAHMRETYSIAGCQPPGVCLSQSGDVVDEEERRRRGPSPDAPPPVQMQPPGGRGSSRHVQQVPRGIDPPPPGTRRQPAEPGGQEAVTVGRAPPTQRMADLHDDEEFPPLG